MRVAKALPIVLLCMAGAGCGDDLTFPELPPDLLEMFCVRGEHTVGDNISATLTDDDCDSADVTAGDVGYFELYRVRVSEATTVIFDADSEFDNVLTVFRLDSYTDVSVTVTEVGFNDDRDPGENLNALVEVTLQPDTDYILAVGGFEYIDVGPYTIEIR